MVKYDAYRPHARVTFDNTELDLKTGEFVTCPSCTKQSFVAECDINNVIKHYSATGVLRHISARAEQGVYMDLPDSLDFQDSLGVIQAAQSAFDSLPSSVRSRFQNNPAEFLAFMSDPGNQDEMIKMGLATDSRALKPEIVSKDGKLPATQKAGSEGGSPPVGGANAP